MKNKQTNILKNWDILHAILVTSGFFLFLIFDCIFPIVILAGTSFAHFIWQNKNIFYTIKPFGGYANWVTIFRLSVLLSLGIFYNNYDGVTIAYIAAFALILDGVDGFLARKLKTASNFGATLDGESDAFFVLLFSVIVYALDYVDAWIMWVGMLRYIYVLVCYLVWQDVLDEPVSYLRKTIAVVIMGVILTPFLLPNQYYIPLLMIATTAITLSFVKSFIFQIKNH